MTSGVLPRSTSFVPFERGELAGSITARFEKIVATHSEMLAIRGKIADVTYHELNRAANRIAHTLLQVGVAAPGNVGLLFKDESQAIAAILGVLKSGHAYVPLDRGFPPDRLRSIIDDCQLRIILTEQELRHLAVGLGAPEADVLSLEDITPNAGDRNPALEIAPTTTAAIFYTSGTTGRPKGVVQDHRAVLHRAMVGTNGLGIGCEDRVTLLTPPTYSASLRNLFTALLTGAAAYPYRPVDDGLGQLGSWLVRERITVYHSVPSLFRGWVSTLSGDEDFSALRIVEFGGETVTSSDVALFRKAFPPTCILASVLSSNETGPIRRLFVDQSTPVGAGVLPVGYPVDDKQVLLLDEEGREVGADQVGEIAVRSHFLSPGYWRRPDLTANVFATDAASGERIYRTGDLGSFLPDGCLVHRGRKDFRAKVRGIRVETDEVQAALQTHPSVKEAAVVIGDDGSGGHKLVAHLGAKPSAGVIDAAVLREFLKTRLPDFMVPAAFVVHDALPRLASGKIDRHALLGLEPSVRTAETASERPRDQLEREVANVWAELFGMPAVSPRDNFFDLGGDSLKAARLAARIEKTFQLPFPAVEIIRSPSVEQVAAVLRQRRRVPDRSPTLVTLHTGEGTRSVFCFLYAGGFRQELFYWAALAPRVRRDYSFYAVMARGADGRSSPLGSVEEMAAACIEDMKAVQPKGPYFLVGDCFSARVAYETARQLRSAGDSIGALWLFDAWGGSPWLDRYIGRKLATSAGHYFKPVRMMCRRVMQQHVIAHITELRSLDGTGPRCQYVLTKVGRLSRMIWRRATGSAAAAPAESSVDGGHIGRAFNAYKLAVRSYRYRPYDGLVTLIATEEWCARHPTLGWRGEHRVKIHRLPGKHAAAYTQQNHLIADILRASILSAEMQMAAAASSPSENVAS